MAYEKQTWTTGETITADNLNHIEGGVRGVNDSYTPTDWETGDVITAEKLNNIEEGIESAGGVDVSGDTVTADKLFLGLLLIMQKANRSLERLQGKTSLQGLSR